MNTKFRTEVKITLRKTLFELMNNAENLRKFRDIKLVTTNQEVASSEKLIIT